MSLVFHTELVIVSDTLWTNTLLTRASDGLIYLPQIICERFVQ